MTILDKVAIGNGINKVRVATTVAKGVDINTGKLATVATKVETMFSHDNHVFNIDGLKMVFDEHYKARRQLRNINGLYSICNIADRAILLFSSDDNKRTDVLIRYKLGHHTKIACVEYLSTGELLVEYGLYGVYKTTDIKDIAHQMCSKHPSLFSGWRWLTINEKQSPNKRRLTIADALSRR